MVNVILVTDTGFLFCFLPVKNIEDADRQVKQRPKGKILVFEVTVGDRTVEAQDILIAYAGEVCH